MHQYTILHYGTSQMLNASNLVKQEAMMQQCSSLTLVCLTYLIRARNIT